MYERQNHYAIKTTPASKTFPKQVQIIPDSPLAFKLPQGEHTSLAPRAQKLTQVMERNTGFAHDYMIYILTDNKRNIWTPTGVHSEGAIVGDWV